MVRRDFLFIALAMILIFAISGCETVPKKFKEEVSGIKTRVDTLETRVEGVETKQSDVERMASEQSQALEELKVSKERGRTNIGVKRIGKSKESVRQIQTCLKNAGFYDGKIDGVRGRKTKHAIVEFQKANALRPDGIVGAKTWGALNKYASGSAFSTGTEEGTTK